MNFFDRKYSKILLQLKITVFYFNIFKMQFIPVMVKLNFQFKVFSVT